MSVLMDNPASPKSEWFFSSFVLHCEISEGPLVFRLREYTTIFRSKSSAFAYEKANEIARNKAAQLTADVGGIWIVDGISELLHVDEPPTSGSELVWTPRELHPHELEVWVRTECELPVGDSLHPSGWYVAEVVIAEIHDTGSHGDKILVWSNLDLIAAGDAVSACRAANELGREQESAVGSHRCEGDAAHWEFKGVRCLRETIDPPHDGAILWFDDLYCTAADLRELIPPRLGLGIFKWEAHREEHAD